MTNKELKQLLDILNKAGVKRFKTADIELELEVVTQASQAIDQALSSQQPPTYTEDELLTWSSSPAGI